MAYTNGSAIVITYGRLDAEPDRAPPLMSIIVSNADIAKALAHTFIAVIPDELTGYQEQINAWKGDYAVPLLITHQDDDTFFFCAVQTGGCFMEPTEDLSGFHRFVQDFQR